MQMFSDYNIFNESANKKAKNQQTKCYNCEKLQDANIKIELLEQQINNLRKITNRIAFMG